MIEWFAPVLQSLLSTALWATGSAAGQGMRRPTEEPSDLLGVFTAQVLDTETLIGAAFNMLQDESAPDEDYMAIFTQPEMQSIVFEALTARLLERYDSIGSVNARLLALTEDTVGESSSNHKSTIAMNIQNCVDAACDKIIENLDEADPSIKSAVQQLAGLSSIDATLRRIDVSLRELGERVRPTRQADAEFETAYRTIVHDRYGSIILPDLDTERSFAFDDIYVPTEIHIAARYVESPIELFAISRRVVLVGQPGGGKSTFASAVMHKYSSDPNSLPFIVVLRKYGQDFENGLSILQHIEKSINTDFQIEPPRGWVESALLSGKATVVFDGLDELLNSSRRREIRNAVQAFSLAHPFAQVLVTSRVVGYDQAPLAVRDFRRAELGEFDTEKVESYVTNWFRRIAIGLTPAEQDARTRGFLRESESVNDLTRNPLLLSLMCALYRGSNYIPEGRLNLYEECAKLLFKRWDRSREIYVDLEIGSDIEPSLMHLALWMLETGQYAEGVTESILVTECAHSLVPGRFERLDDAERVAEEFIRFCRGRAWVLADAGLTADGERRFTFTHRTFLEYYAACQVARLEGTPEKIANRMLPRIASGEWDVTAQLTLLISAKAHHMGTDRFLSEIVAGGSGGDAEEQQILAFAARSLSYSVPSPLLIRRITRDVYEFALAERFEKLSAADFVVIYPPISVLLGAPLRTRLTVSDELGLLVRKDITQVAPADKRRNSIAITIAVFARIISDVGLLLHADEPYEFWTRWSAQALADFKWNSEFYDRELPEGAIGLLELGYITTQQFLETFPFELLTRTFDNDGLNLRRIGTLELLEGYLIGYFWEYVFLPGRANSLLRSMIDAFPVIQFPIQWLGGDNVGLMTETLHGERYSDLPNDLLPGAVLLRCMMEERIQLEGKRPHAREPIPLNSLRFEPLVSALASMRRLVDTQNWSLPDHLVDTWNLLPEALQNVLTAWALNTFDFWKAAPPSIPAGRS